MTKINQELIIYPKYSEHDYFSKKTMINDIFDKFTVSRLTCYLKHHFLYTCILNLITYNNILPQQQQQQFEGDILCILLG